MSNTRVTVVVPAYKEGPNVTPLTERLFAALKKEGIDQTTELIFVDDNSKDETADAVKKLESKYPVRLIIRTTERGLSSAVLRGFAEAKGQILICMDGDLQHPPESVPDLIKALEKGSEFVIGTRYGKGGNSVDKDWPLYRRVISAGARMMARPLTPLSDPMSGFFGVTRAAYERAKKNGINPIGFKIALEMYAKANIKKHSEVPINFGVRQFGYSKLTGGVIINYLVHLRELYGFSMPMFLPIFFAVLTILAVLFFYIVAKMI
jgi:dolichol-phosphate mannosyltransferase